MYGFPRRPKEVWDPVDPLLKEFLISYATQFLLRASVPFRALGGSDSTPPKSAACRDPKISFQFLGFPECVFSLMSLLSWTPVLTQVRCLLCSGLTHLKLSPFTGTKTIKPTGKMYTKHLRTECILLKIFLQGGQRITSKERKQRILPHASHGTASSILWCLGAYSVSTHNSSFRKQT